MKVSLRQHPSSQTFAGYVPDPKDAKKFLLKNKKFQTWDTLSFLTAVTSATGFAVGGIGLLSDYLSTEKKQTAIKNSAFVPNSFKSFESAGMQGVVVEPKKDNKKAKTEVKEEGAKTIVPSTKFSKLGLTFAKIGIAFSGIAGIFNGVSMGLPMMAAGEALNLGASPIIETPLGTGLFGIALAAVFSGRALENDPELKMDYAKLRAEKSLKNKALAVWKNIEGCAKEVWKSGRVITTNLGDLFKKDKKAQAISFFRDNVFSIKPKKLVLQEFVDEKGAVTIVKTFKSNPYLMHGASLLLAAGGLTLALSSIIKNSTGQKVGLKTYEVGGSLDNLSLSRWGMEKAAIASAGDPAAKLAGYLLGASGLTILAGQPGVDEKWGRGIQWVGTALLFSVFAVERLPKAFKTLVSKPEFKALIRQWEIDLTKVYSNKELKAKLGPIVKAISNGEKTGDSIVDGIIKVAEDAIKQDKVKGTNIKVKLKTKGGLKDRSFVVIKGKHSLYRSSKEEVGADIKAGFESNPLLKGKYDNAFSHFGKDDNLQAVKSSMKNQSEKEFKTK